MGWLSARNGQVKPAGLGLSRGSRVVGCSAAWPHACIRTAAPALGGGRYRDAALHRGGLLILPPAARSQQVKVDPEKLWLALVDGARASPSPQGESKVLSGGGGQEPPEQVKHERLTGKGHGEF